MHGFLSTLLASWALLIVIKFLDPSRNLLRKRKSSNSYALIIRLTDWIQITSDFAVWNREFNFSSTTPKKRRDARQQDIFCFDSSWHWTLNLSRLECSCGQVWYLILTCCIQQVVKIPLKHAPFSYDSDDLQQNELQHNLVSTNRKTTIIIWPKYNLHNSLTLFNHFRPVKWQAEYFAKEWSE